MSWQLQLHCGGLLISEAHELITTNDTDMFEVVLFLSNVHRVLAVLYYTLTLLPPWSNHLIMFQWSDTVCLRVAYSSLRPPIT